MNVYLVDDEKHALGMMKHYLAKMPDVTVVGASEDPIRAIEEINTLKPDLVFLDIQMPILTGIELLPYLREKPMIVFCTAYDQHAIKAFELNALDYLLKPVNRDRLAASIARARSQWEVLEVFQDEQMDGGLEKVVVSILGKSHVVWLEQAMVFTKDGRYTNILTLEGRELLANLTIGYLADHIKDPRFFQINRSEIIQKRFITAFEPGEHGTLTLMGANDKPYQVARRRVKDFKAWFL
ncbi:LytR/AlgR family response regulator transcription factor [Acanthopleuribacter pedis]|uniref:Response regulator transcription factor n=1 Tax=Acanthopleuribacter pedis TaxID=442870 RepID=A0A8J7U8A6_9BACT|nr:LytTR family DNA-binding domain-containing protein [Acanthopleuribacter pedis]MBO1322326.1 response regulator transcription factor [Acanthopleuribacter pedis]